MNERPVGLTKDVGWQIGVSRTLPVPAEDLWELLVSAEGLALWLGEGVEVPLTEGRRYETANGTSGEIRSVRPNDRVRLTWLPPDRSAPATVQVAVRPAATGASVRFHTEHLSSSEERELMRTHWKVVAAELGAMVS